MSAFIPNLPLWEGHRYRNIPADFEIHLDEANVYLIDQGHTAHVALRSPVSQKSMDVMVFQLTKHLEYIGTSRAA